MIAEAESIEANDLALADIAAEIRELHRCTTIEGVLKIGCHLYAVNEVLAQNGYGRFIKWVESECKFTRRTASSYISVYRAFGELDVDWETVSQSMPVRSFYELARHPEPIRERVLELAAASERVTPAKVKAEAARFQPTEASIRISDRMVTGFLSDETMHLESNTSI